MFLEPDIIGKLIPHGMPPPELVPEPARVLAAGLINRPLLNRSYLWASALLNAGFQSALPVPSRFVHASAGFVSLQNTSLPPALAHLSSGIGFGIYILAERSEGPTGVRILRLGDQSFPVVTTYGEVALHGCPPHPVNAASTCWVRNLATSPSWTHGILTCRHAVRTLPMGTSVSLSASMDHSLPGSSTLADRDGCTIDAAVLEIDPADWPSGVTRLSVARPSAPGQSVQFQDRSGTTHAGSILRVFSYNTYIGNLFGQRVIADCHAVAGDSGSFLSDTASGEAVGIYMGTIPDGAGGTDGIFQDLAQVESFFELEVHY
jgi:hypothetical protein